MNKIKTTLTKAFLCFTLVASFVSMQFVPAFADASTEETIVTLGADLTAKERATVLDLLGLTEEDLDSCKVLEITNEDEHNYLDGYLSNDVIGSRALSSIKLIKTDSGNGIQVQTQNIGYCTESMYVNALATAGVEDAEVTVAGPFSISGTAALVGVMKAYEEISGEEISEEVKDAATDELVTTGKIADSIDDSEKASELVGLIKNQIVAQDITSKDDIKEIVEQAADELNISLTDENVNDIVSTMSKISKLDLNADTLKEQAQGLYDKLKSMDIHIDKEKADNLFQKLIAFFQKVYDKIIELFS